MVFSLPNMQKWLENKFTNCLNYEHTIFLNETLIDYLLSKHNFKILQKYYFKDHSIFYATQKVESLKMINLKNEYAQNKALFLEMLEFYKEKIAFLNDKINKSSKEIYLFGAHLFSQYLLYHGLESSKIKGILDNNKTKQGKRLYGSKLQVFSPLILKDKNALIILNAGVYNEEIKKDILENINENVEFI